MVERKRCDCTSKIACGRRGVEERDEAVDDAVDDLAEQFLLAREVAIEGRWPYGNGIGHVADRDVLVATRSK